MAKLYLKNHKKFEKKKISRQRTTNPETSDIRENKIILIKKGNPTKRRKGFFKQNNEKNSPISCSKKPENNEATAKNISEEDKMSKEGGEEIQNSRILIYVDEKKDGESFNNQEDISSENFACFPCDDNNIENSSDKIDFAFAGQLQFNGPNRDNQ